MGIPVGLIFVVMAAVGGYMYWTLVGMLLQAMF